MNVRQFTHTTVFHFISSHINIKREEGPDVNSANSSSGDLLTVFLPSFFEQARKHKKLTFIIPANEMKFQLLFDFDDAAAAAERRFEDLIHGNPVFVRHSLHTLVFHLTHC